MPVLGLPSQMGKCMIPRNVLRDVLEYINWSNMQDDNGNIGKQLSLSNMDPVLSYL